MGKLKYPNGNTKPAKDCVVCEGAGTYTNGHNGEEKKCDCWFAPSVRKIREDKALRRCKSLVYRAKRELTEATWDDETPSQLLTRINKLIRVVRQDEREKIKAGY